MGTTLWVLRELRTLEVYSENSRADFSKGLRANMRRSARAGSAKEDIGNTGKNWKAGRLYCEHLFENLVTEIHGAFTGAAIYNNIFCKA